MSPKILAIIVNWNKRDMLDSMLESLRASGLPENLDAVVVDNASTDGSVEMIREKHVWCRVLELPENVGGTGGFNAGMRHGLEHEKGYDFFWLLDNDVIIHPGAAQALLEPLERDPKLGIVGSAILLMDDPGYVQECGARVNWKRGSLSPVLEGPLEDLPKNQLVGADYCAACSLMVRVEAVRQVGIWDPGYFVLWDDVEWGVRFGRAGWKVAATTASQVRHESYRNRRGRNAAFSVYQGFRNNFYFLWRFAPAVSRIRALFQQFRYALTFADHCRVSGRTTEALAIRLAIQDFFSGRMGPPRPELQARPGASAEAPARGAELPDGGRLRRVAVFARDNPDFARELHSRLSRELPDARIDTLVLNPTSEMEQQTLPNRRYGNITTFAGRMKLMFTLPLRYDAVAAPAFLHPYFFEKLVPFQLRFADDLSLTETVRRDPFVLVRLTGMRLRTLITAAFLTVRAQFKPRSAVDYFGFRR